MRQYLSVAAAAIFLLAACSKATPDNYQKIEVGMNRDQVHQILGKPSKVEGDVGDAAMNIWVETWNNDPHVVTITYGGSVVSMKSSSTEEQKK